VCVLCVGVVCVCVGYVCVCVCVGVCVRFMCVCVCVYACACVFWLCVWCVCVCVCAVNLVTVNTVSPNSEYSLRAHSFSIAYCNNFEVARQKTANFRQCTVAISCFPQH